jgi:hypothetical protein
MTESEWARRMAQQFKTVRARKAEEEARLQVEERNRREAGSELWTDVREAFRHKAQMFNAAVSEEVLTWEAANTNTFTLRRKDIEGCVKGSYQEAGHEIKVEVLGRSVPFQVTFETRAGEYCLVGAGGEPSEAGDLAETLIGEFLGK